MEKYKDGGSISKIIKAQFGISVKTPITTTVAQTADNNKFMPTINPVINLVNNSKAEFVNRLKDPNRKTIVNWENPNQISTHKMAYSEVDGKTYVYPMIQEINGQLHDFSDPKYNHKKWDVLDSAIKNNDYVIMPDAKTAEWFTNNNYKQFYPGFNKYKKGGVISKILKAQNGSFLNAVDSSNISTPIAVQMQNTNNKWVPSDIIKNQLRKWEGNSMYANASIASKAKEVENITPNFNLLKPNQQDSLFSYYYNISPQTYKRTIVPLTQALSSAQSDEDRANIESRIANNINVGMNRPNMRGLTNRRIYEQNLFKNGY
jgi:hypothetical protein